MDIDAKHFAARGKNQKRKYLSRKSENPEKSTTTYVGLERKYSQELMKKVVLSFVLASRYTSG